MKQKIKIVGLPDKLKTASQGMSVNNGNQNPAIAPNLTDASLVNSAPNVKVNRSLKPVKRKDANLEAEKGETVVTYLNGDGITEFYNIGGKRHYDGGTPLNLPDNSFIFSRDRSMKIKDKAILKDFGKNDSKKGKNSFTPAELSKPYNINQYRQVLADPTSDRIMRESAILMIENYNLKLGKLALVQESQKGFPAGIPQVSLPYLESIGIPPEELVPPQEQQQQQQQQLPMARYGGIPMHQIPPGETLTPMDILNPLDTKGYQNWYQGQPQVGVVGQKQMYDVAGSSKSKLDINGRNLFNKGIVSAFGPNNRSVTSKNIADQNFYTDPTESLQGYTSSNAFTPPSISGFGPGVARKGGQSFESHMMYDPETGEGFMADAYKDHLRMNEMGYGHSAPKMAQGGERVRFNPASGNYDVVSLGGQVIGTMMAPSMDNGIPEYQEGSETGGPKMWTKEELELNQGEQKDGDVLKIGDKYYRITNTPIDSKGGKPGDEGTYPIADVKPIDNWIDINHWDGSNVTTTSADVDKTTEVDETTGVDQTTEAVVDDPTTTVTPADVDKTTTTSVDDMNKQVAILIEKIENDEPLTDEDKKIYDEYENSIKSSDDSSIETSDVTGIEGSGQTWKPGNTDFYDEDKVAIRANAMAGLLGRNSGVPVRSFKETQLQTPYIADPTAARMAELSTQKNIYDASMLGGRDAMTYGARLAATPSGVIPQYDQMNMQNMANIGNQNIQALNQQRSWEANARDVFGRDVERGREANNRRLLGVIAQDANLRSKAIGNVRSRELANSMNKQYDLTGDYRNPIVFDPRYTTDTEATNQQTAEGRLQKATDAWGEMNADAKTKTSVRDVYNMMYGKQAAAGEEYEQKYNQPYTPPSNQTR